MNHCAHRHNCRQTARWAERMPLIAGCNAVGPGFHLLRIDRVAPMEKGRPALDCPEALFAIHLDQVAEVRKFD